MDSGSRPIVAIDVLVAVAVVVVAAVVVAVAVVGGLTPAQHLPGRSLWMKNGRKKRPIEIKE